MYMYISKENMKMTWLKVSLVSPCSLCISGLQ